MIGPFGGKRKKCVTERRSTPSGPKAGTARAKFCGSHCGYACQSRRVVTPPHCFSVGVPSNLKFKSINFFHFFILKLLVINKTKANEINLVRDLKI